jgi:predicted nucleic acid-binding protein
MEILRIVIDTNILVAAILSGRGASARLIELCGKGLFNHILSIPLAFEYEAACRFCVRDTVSAEALLNALIQSATLVEIPFLLRPLLHDPSDEMVLEAAANGGCRYVVTFNKRHFAGARSYGISVVSPGEFLTIIGR